MSAKKNMDQNISDPKTLREAQQRKAEKRSNLMYGTIAVIFVLVAIVCIVWKSNVIPKTATAATVNGEKYTAAEVNFYYKSTIQNFYNQNYYLISYLGLDLSGNLREQTYAEDKSWFDFFLEQAMNQMADIQALNDAAAKEGFTWNDELQAQLDESLESMKSTASSYGYTTKQYLSMTFGSTMTEKIYTEQMKRAILAEAYSQQYQDSLTYSESDLSSAYAEDPNSYDYVSYEFIRVNGAASSTDDDGNEIEVTDAMRTEAMAAAKQLANDLYDSYKSGESLETLADSDDKAYYSSEEQGSWSDTVLMNWLFDSARKAGNAAVLEDEDSTCYYVAVFHERGREETNTINVRHILIQPETGELSEGDEGYEDEQTQLKADAKQKAEDLLAQWKAGDATEDSFAQLANENSSDGGSNTNGGLYEQVAPGDMVTEFNDWCFDASRKSGDTGIVETTYGYHVMYFVGTDLPYWQVQVRDALVENDYTAWYTEKTDGYTAEQSSFGVQFVG